MARVELRSGESQESLLKRFRKEVSKSRILSEVRKRRWFISNAEKKRVARRKARRRELKRQRGRRRYSRGR